MKARIYAPLCSFPPADGASQVIVQQASDLARLGFETELVNWFGPNGGAPSQAPARLTHLRETPFLENPMQRRARVLTALARGIPSPELFHYPLDSEVVESLERLAQAPADLGIYHYSFCHAWLSRGISGGEKKKVVVYHNLESELALLRSRHASNLPERLLHRINAHTLARHERELARLVDEAWFLSPLDQAKWAEGATAEAASKARFVSPSFSSELFSRRKKRYLSRLQSHPQAPSPVLGFAAALDFQPNIESLGWLLGELAPELERGGFSGTLLVAGKNLGRELQEKIASFPFIRYLGFVPDLEDFWAALDLSLAPDLGGSGVRIKALESIASGIPTLVHPVSAERVDPSLRGHPLLFVSASARQWAERIRDVEVESGADSKSLRKTYAESSSELPKCLQASTIYGFLLDSK